jgi:hypothetical protein
MLNLIYKFPLVLVPIIGIPYPTTSLNYCGLNRKNIYFGISSRLTLKIRSSNVLTSTGSQAIARAKVI